MREVVRITWDWRNTRGDARLTSADSMRKPALVQAVVLTAFGFLLAFGLGHQPAARVVWTLAGLVALLGAFWPEGYRPVHAFGQKIGRWVGKILRYVLLAPFYLLFFGLVSYWLKLRGRDPLQRAYLADQWTYWIPRREKEPGENFGDQYLYENKAARIELRPLGSVTRDRESGAE